MTDEMRAVQSGDRSAVQLDDRSAVQSADWMDDHWVVTTDAMTAVL